MTTVATLDQMEYIANSGEQIVKTTTAAPIAAILPALTPMKRDANKKLVPCTAIADVVVGLTVPGAKSDYNGLVGYPINGSDFAISVYTKASIYGDKVNFALVTDADTQLKKEAMFDRTGIDIVFVAAGF